MLLHTLCQNFSAPITEIRSGRYQFGRWQIFKFSIPFLRREKRQEQRQVPFGLQEIFLRLYLYAKRIFQP